MATNKESPKTLLRRSYENTKLMFRALEENNKSMMELLFKQGELRINACLPTGETLLQIAVLYGHSIMVIQRLVRTGCHINSTDSTGDTALHMAVRYHRIHLAVELIRLGADVRARNNKGETPLHVAVANKSHVDVLKEMIPNGDRYLEMDFYGIYSLRLATAPWRRRDWISLLVANYKGKTIYDDELRGLVKILLDAGADVNASDINGCSPLQCAVYTGDLKLVQALINAGADLNHRNDMGMAVLHDAVLCCNEAMVHFLLSRGAEVDIETDSERGDTALHWAIQLNIDNSHKKIIKRLIEFGSDIHHENGILAETPVHYVLQYGDVNLVNLFINKHKADLNKLQSHWGNNALGFAAQNEDERVIDLVLQKSDVLEIDHRCTEDRSTPLHQASAMSLLGNVRQLISRGADVNAKDLMDRTPLFQCLFGRKLQEEVGEMKLAFLRANYKDERRQVMRLLLECGANVNNVFETYEETKQTIIELAIALEDSEAWMMIIEYAAEVEARTNKPLFDEHNFQVIKENSAVESYYQNCQDELTDMRTTKIEGSFVSYLAVLTQPLDVVARYTRNEELVRNLQFTLHTDSYPIYVWQLKDKFDAAIARKNAIQQVSAVLSKTLQFAKPTELILENIIKYLTDDDIKFLNGSAEATN